MRKKKQSALKKPAAASNEGCDDKPGFAHLPAVSRLLFVGNRFSAAFDRFDAVISTCTPVDCRGKGAPKLSTHRLRFNDTMTWQVRRLARKRFGEGAAVIAKSVAAGKRVLVHCEYGQNRSGAIACSYAVLCRGWTAERAIEYMRKQNLADRSYDSQYPMHNDVFNSLLEEFERDRARLLAELHLPDHSNV